MKTTMVNSGLKRLSPKFNREDGSEVQEKKRYLSKLNTSETAASR